MKRHQYRRAPLTRILVSVFISATFIATIVANFSDASALTYQSGVGVNFTFNPTISVNLSGNLVIENLIPGSSSDSNIIDVMVSTNTTYGYNLSATVGQKSGTTNLVNEKNSSYTFTSLASTASTLANFSDNTWGYSYSADDGTTWVSGNTGSTTSGYAGLPLDDNGDTTELGKGGITLISTTDPADSKTIKFKIGAKASSEQASGTYTNTINFYAVTNPAPMTLSDSYASAGKTKYHGYYKLQDMDSSICEATEVLDEGSQMQAIDTRDDKIYWITKLQDGHCWMTQNLDLDLDSSITLTHDDTDLGYGTDTTTTSWTPDKSTIAWDGSSFSGWSNNDDEQYSADPGDYYYAGYDGTTLLPSSATNYLTITADSNGDIINSSNSNVYFSTDPSRVNGGTHEHVGNYYNWSATVAMNDTSSYSSDTYSDISGNPQNSICPAGWRLPIITSASPTYDTDGSQNEFARLVYLYNNNSYVTNSSAKLELSPLFFSRSGNAFGASLGNSGSLGLYWSSTVDSASYAYDLNFGATNVIPTRYSYRSNGFTVRCLAR